MRLARAVYGEQLDGRSSEEVHAAMDAWGEDGEELFILSHLSFLQLQAQRDLLFAHREMLDGLGEVVEEQQRTRELLVKLGRLLKQELGELAGLLEEAGEALEGEEPVEPDALIPPPEIPKPVVLPHPEPE